MADPTRRRIIDLLRKGDRSPVELVQVIGASHPTLSHHLNVLRTAGVVSQRRVGRNRVYRLHSDSLRPASVWIQVQLT